MKKYHYVYQTKNLINGKTYIGVHSTNNLNDGYIGCGVRSQAYANSCKNKNFKSAFLDAVVKYGYDNFKTIILDFYNSKKEAYEEESFLVNEQWVKDKNNYNICLGGYGGTSINNLLQDESIFKDFMNGMTKRDICNKYSISPSKIYRITKNRNTSNRKTVLTRSKYRLDKIIAHRRREIAYRFLNGESIESINKDCGFDIVKNNILKYVFRYVLLKDGQFVCFFNFIKEVPKEHRNKIKSFSYVRATLNGSCKSVHGYNAVRYIDFTNGVTNYYTEKKYDSPDKGVRLIKNGLVYEISTTVMDFCREHNLHQSALWRVLRGKQKTTNGFMLYEKDSKILQNKEG